MFLKVFDIIMMLCINYSLIANSVVFHITMVNSIQLFLMLSGKSNGCKVRLRLSINYLR